MKLMKILFIFTNIATGNIKQYPHGIGALSAVLKKAGHQAELLYLTKKIKPEKLLKKIAGFSFDLAGISTTTNQWEIVKSFPAWIKKNYPAVPIILGGIHPTLAPDEVINTAGVDIICRGEGEVPLLKLVEAMEKGQDYSNIPSLWVKRQKNGKMEIIRNPIMPLVENLDTLPFSDREILDYQELLFNHSYYEQPQEATIMAGRGCPFDCTYCCNNSLKNLYHQNQIYARKRSVDNVIAELKILTKNYAIKSFYFEDDTFTLNRRWVEEFCLKYKQAVGLPFKIYLRPLTADYDLLKKLKDAGLYEAQVGVECGNEKFRRERLKRSITNRQLIELFGWLKRLRISQFAFMVIGFPAETKELIVESMDFIKKIHPHHTQVSVYYPYPANELYNYCQKNRLLTPQTKTTFFGGFSTIKLNQISPQELKRLHDDFCQLSFQLKKTWLKPIKKSSNVRIKKTPASGSGRLAELKFLFYKFYFVLIKLPIFLAREPYWLLKLARSRQKYGLYKALQTAYDYHVMLDNYSLDRLQVKKEIVHFKPILLKKTDKIEFFSYQPKISVIVPIFNPEIEILHAAIKSVLRQSYQNWELCLVEGSWRKNTLIGDMLNYYARKDGRVKIKFLPKNRGIAGNSNEAIKMVTGEYIGFLDHDDELAPEALLEVVGALNGPGRGAEIIYTDEDKIDPDGSYSEPFYKPDLSPDYLMSVNYICHLAIIKAELLKNIGGFDAGTEGAQDYDLFLRAAEQAKKIYHVPKVLYHWRKISSSTAAISGCKPYVAQASKKVLTAALRRRQIKGEVIRLDDSDLNRVKYAISGNPMISIIIPFKDNVALVKKCLAGILKKTAYENYEIILVDNRSRESLAEYLSVLRQKRRQSIKLISYGQDFNFSAINNLAARQASGQYLLLLNNDTEVITAEWLGAMLEQAQRKTTGAVGAKLFYPNNKIQHCGIRLDHSKIGEHFYRGLRDEKITDPGYRSNCVNNVSAVTGACLMVRKDVFDEVNGFDPALPNNYNDIDFCLKLRSQGYLIVYTPFAQLYHYESATRLPLAEQWEKQYLQKKWGQAISHDPYFH